ncbi:MAG: hypothetical protein ACOY40_03105 [Bacillota bacterium]
MLRPVHEQRKEGISVQNRTGDLRLKFKDYEEAAPVKQPAAATKGGEAGDAVLQRAPGSGGPGVKSNSRPHPSSGEADPLLSRIEQKYISRLQSLGSIYEAKLNGLVAAAMNELASARKDNPNADITPLVKKYYAAGRALEAECDSQVYAVLESFERELKANSFPPDAALKARETYEARKSSKVAQITAGRP